MICCGKDKGFSVVGEGIGRWIMRDNKIKVIERIWFFLVGSVIFCDSSL